jgi:hypothetical protein
VDNRLTRFFVILAWLSCGCRDDREVFRQDFGVPDPLLFKVFGRTGSVEPGADGLELRVADGDTGQVGLAFLPKIVGDFEVTASFALADSPPKPTGAAEVGLSIETDTAFGQSLSAEQRLFPDSEGWGAATHATEDEWGRRQVRKVQTYARGPSGSLRLFRSGSRVEASCGGKGGTFQPLMSAELGRGQVIGLRLWCAHAGEGATAVKLKSIEIRSDEIAPPGPRTPSAGMTRGAARRFAATLTINLLLAVALAVWRFSATRAHGTGSGSRE